MAFQCSRLARRDCSIWTPPVGTYRFSDAIDSDGQGIRNGEVLGVLGEDRREHARDNVDNLAVRKISEVRSRGRAEKGWADWVCSGV